MVMKMKKKMVEKNTRNMDSKDDKKMVKKKLSPAKKDCYK